jgi:phosphoribosyl-ATP pyrophosphohydrolase/phosphoribosyl-AMP cyclohydrolase
MINLDAIKWNDAGLIPVIAQATDGRVLMLAYANTEALEKTLETGVMHYWSRSRQQLWQKGETSGNIQKVISLSLDCDNDTILAKVEQTGPACHTGEATCFGDVEPDIFTQLWQVFKQRQANQDEDSYVNKLLDNPRRLRQKIGEEGVEVALADTDDELTYEVGDLIFHLSVLLFSKGFTWEQIFDELQRRRK